jgi:hypothetical protein
MKCMSSVQNWPPHTFQQPTQKQLHPILNRMCRTRRQCADQVFFDHAALNYNISRAAVALAASTPCLLRIYWASATCIAEEWSYVATTCTLDRRYTVSNNILKSIWKKTIRLNFRHFPCLAKVIQSPFQHNCKWKTKQVIMPWLEPSENTKLCSLQSAATLKCVHLIYGNWSLELHPSLIQPTACRPSTHTVPTPTVSVPHGPLNRSLIRNLLQDIKLHIKRVHARTHARSTWHR